MPTGNEPSPLIRAFITEDDPLNCELLKDLLTDHFPEVRLTGTSGTLKGTRDFLAAHGIDLLFLDIELPDGTGFDLLSSMKEVGFEVIVTTAHSRYALDAIHYSALDYLLKPVQKNELGDALARFTHRFALSHRQPGTQQAHVPPIQKIPLPTSEGFIFVNTEDIVNLEADRAYSLFYLRDGRKILVSKPMSDFEDRLTRRNFYRVHHSHIINLLQVNKYVRGEGGHVVMANDKIIPVSRSRKESFLELIAGL